jgi:N-acetylglucosaminyl-diphospho-decaprenol L-rhamnosyltransferase
VSGADGVREDAPVIATSPLTVVVVHWNQPDAAATTVAGLREQSSVASAGLRVIVVDNDSRPPARERLHALLDGAPQVEILDLPMNGGFSGGANAGLQHWLDDPDGSEWALLCPHDVDLAPDCTELLLAAVEARPAAGLACADVGDGRIPHIDPYFGGITLPGSPEPGWQPADYPHGTLMAVRRACLQQVGLFDDTYFAYCEEAELALRARAAGWECGLVRGARVQNVQLGSSLAVVDYLQQRNTLRLVRMMSGRYHVTIRLIITLIQITSGVLRPAGAPPVFHPRARLLGMRDFILKRHGAPPAEFTA